MKTLIMELVSLQRKEYTFSGIVIYYPSFTLRLTVFFVYHSSSRLPQWIRSLIPRIFYVTEKSWNYYPRTLTEYTVSKILSLGSRIQLDDSFLIYYSVPASQSLLLLLKLAIKMIQEHMKM